MTKLIATLLLLFAVVHTSQAQNKKLDNRLKQFVIVLDNKYTPEISRKQAIMLGFSINDYNNFMKNLDSLNATQTRPIYLYENNFLGFFIKYENDKLVLDLSLQHALKAGATVQGYQAIQQLVKDYNKNLSKQELQEFINHLNSEEAKMMKFINANPDKTVNDYLEIQKIKAKADFDRVTRYKK